MVEFVVVVLGCFCRNECYYIRLVNYDNFGLDMFVWIWYCVDFFLMVWEWMDDGRNGMRILMFYV